MENESKPGFTIATRQMADILFGPVLDPIAGGASIVLPIKEVSGYARVNILGISAQPFTVLVEEANEADGTFVAAVSFASILDAVSGLQNVCELVFPCGSFMRITVTNTGVVVADVAFNGSGLPHGSGAAGTGGGATGVQGPTGSTGIQGMTGLGLGATGIQGATGVQGTLASADVNLLSQGRLTLASLDPAPVADQIGKSTLYFTPYDGNRIALYTGGVWELLAFSEINLVLAGLTSGKNYDVFAYDAAGTLTLELSAAWASDSTRTDALALQDGVFVKAADHSRRYQGTIRATGATTTEDSNVKRFVVNWYNQQDAPMEVTANYSDDDATTFYNVNNYNAYAPVTGMQLAFLTLGTYAIYGAIKYRTLADSQTHSVLGIGFDSASQPDQADDVPTGAVLAGSFGKWKQLAAGYHTIDFLFSSFSPPSFGGQGLYADFARNGAAADPKVTTTYATVKR